MLIWLIEKKQINKIYFSVLNLFALYELLYDPIHSFKAQFD